MSLPQDLEAIKDKIKDRVEKFGAELIDLRFRHVGGGRSVITVVADKVGGITLDDCAAINRDLGNLFDELNVIDKAYYLEVNSPGLDRPLVTEKDFSRAVGETIRILQKEDSGRTVTRIGKLIAVANGALEFVTQNDAVLSTVPLDSIVKAVREIKIK